MRGIATGTAFKQLVAKTLARQLSTEVEATCAPFQFALSTRNESNDRCKPDDHRVVGGWNRSVRPCAPHCDDVETVGSPQHALPFVRQAYGPATSHSWQDAEQKHRIGEQGDPLMPMLLLAEVKLHLVEGRHLFADWRSLQAFNCTGAKPVSGVVQEYVQMASSTWVRKFGVHQAPRYWALLPDLQCAWQMLIQCAAP